MPGPYPSRTASLLAWTSRWGTSRPPELNVRNTPPRFGCALAAAPEVALTAAPVAALAGVPAAEGVETAARVAATVAVAAPPLLLLLLPPHPTSASAVTATPPLAAVCSSRRRLMAPFSLRRAQ